MKSSTFFIVIFSVLYGGTVRAAGIEMHTLMQFLAENKNIKSEFVERKFLRVLDQPVESSGELIFQAPQRLEKNTKLPRAERLLIEGNRVAIERGSFKRSLALDEFAEIGSMVQSLTSTFRGDQLGIEKYFAWTLSGSESKWYLVLKPKEGKLFPTLREIRMSGESNYVHTVETSLADGDRSLMTMGRPVKISPP